MDNSIPKDHLVQLITVLHPDAKIYLFGSRARGDAGQGSDIDLAIDVGRTLTISERGRLKGILNSYGCLYPIDVVDFNGSVFHSQGKLTVQRSSDSQGCLFGYQSSAEAGALGLADRRIDCSTHRSDYSPFSRVKQR